MANNPGLEKTGIDWLRYFFEFKPDARNFYRNFTGKTLDDLCGRPYIKIIAGKYMAELGILVEHLEVFS